MIPRLLSISLSLLLITATFEGARPVNAIPTSPIAATASSTPSLLSVNVVSALDPSPSSMTSQDPSPLSISASDPKAQSFSGNQVPSETIKVVANDGSQHYYPQRQVYTQPTASSSPSPPIQKRDSFLATSDTAKVATDDAETGAASSKAQFRAPVNPRLPNGYVYPMPSLLRPGVGVGEVRCHYDRRRSGLLHCTNGYSYALIAPEPYTGATGDQTTSASSSSSSSTASSSSSAKKPSTEKRSSGVSAAVPQAGPQAAPQGTPQGTPQGDVTAMNQVSTAACPCQSGKPGSSEVPMKKRSSASTGETAPSSAASGTKSGPGSAAAMGVGSVGSGDPYSYAPTTSSMQPREPRSKFCGDGGAKGTDWWHAFGAESAFDADEHGWSKYAGSEEVKSKSGVASTGTEARTACATCVGSGSKVVYGQGQGQGQGQAHTESSGKKKKSKQVKREVLAPGAHGPEAVSVPIHIPLLWDGTNVVSPPGYGGQFDAGVDYPLDADTEVVPVPINIAALVAPDGTMTLLRSN